MIIRNGESVFRSHEQQYSFNFPYQLGTSSKTTPNDVYHFHIDIIQFV